MRTTLSILLCVTAACVPELAIGGQDDVAQGRDSRKNIVLIAGMKSHGPEGNGIHDYAWSVRLVKTMLETSNVRDQVNVRTHFNGWPDEEDLLRQADTIMVISDGRDGDTGREAPHLAAAHRIRLVEELAARGCGVVTFHFSTFAPDSLSEKVLQWYGGYFDWETDGRRKWYSRIETLEAVVSPATADHPVLNGVKPFKIREEFYYDIRFRDNDDGWTPIWKVDALPATQTNGNIVAWIVEREGGQRGFATTCGHFYENWKDPNFRKTILNGLAWSAHVTIPPEGISSDFFTHDQIARHLAQPELIESPAAAVKPSDEAVYADDPYWYQPGHPIKPAEGRSIKTLPGFRADKVLTVPEELGSWTALGIDPRGRLLCAAQHQPGIFRVTMPPAGSTADTKPRVEKLQGVAEQMGWSHGLLAAFDSLYVTIAEDNEKLEGGVYRLRDTDGDDQYDDMTQLFELNRSGEHGPHNIVVSPDGKWLYMICGNGTRLPRRVSRRYPSSTDGVDHLIPSGFGHSEHTVGGFVLRFRPDGSKLELICSGLRNSYDLAFNHYGDLFTFDSDMEWDLGAPWYRPTRICHMVPGGEFGWRGDAAKWPDYFEDSVAPVINVGPGSPTGVVFGYQARFPAKYQHALFACDWTFATIHAIHLEPQGASYRAKIEEFLGGVGLPVTDLVIGSDGAMYFIVGGRRLGSALYRVQYVGNEPTRTVRPAEMQNTPKALHRLRRQLEAFHGIKDEQAIATAWKHLGHSDRAIRFAARVAIESQPVAAWRERADAETDLEAELNALIALARKDVPDRLVEVIRLLGEIDASKLSARRVLCWLRAYELALARGEDEVVSEHDAVVQKLRPLFPHEDPRVNRELSRLLCFLGDRSIIEPILTEMAADVGQRPKLGGSYFVRNKKYGVAIRDILQAAPLVDRMHYAQMLLWIDDDWDPQQRTEYFRLIADAPAHTKGGYWYVEFWERIREQALDRLPADQREQYASIAVTRSVPSDEHDLPQPEGPGQEWTLEQLLKVVESNLRARDYDNGKKMFSAATCVSCHRLGGEGSSVGPDLSAIGQRFTLRDILVATLHPSKAVSDQYRVSILFLDDGRTVSGRVVSRDNATLTIATDLRRPSQTTRINMDQIEDEELTPISTMPEELLNPLNVDEVLDLLAYLIAGGNEQHPVFTR